MSNQSVRQATLDQIRDDIRRVATATARSEYRPPLVKCDCGERAVKRVAVYSGVTVTTFYACAACAEKGANS